MFRKLTPADVDIIKNIIQPLKLYEFTETFLSELKMWHAFGLFNDETNELIGISTSFFNGDLPEWNLLTQYCDDATDLKILVENVCSHYEKLKVYKFYWVDADYNVDYMPNFIPERYKTVVEYKVDPFKKPRFSKHYETLYCSQMLTVPSTVHLSVLPTSFRKL